MGWIYKTKKTKTGLNLYITNKSTLGWIYKQLWAGFIKKLWAGFKKNNICAKLIKQIKKTTLQNENIKQKTIDCK